MNPVFIHTFTAAQARQLHVLYLGEWWSRGRTEAEVEQMLAGPGLAFGVARPDTGELMAFARAITDGVFKAFLFDVIVHPECRGQGLGTALMNHVLEHPAIRHVRHVELYCLPERTGYYAEFGFSGDPARELVLMRRTNEPAAPPLAQPPALP